VELYPYGARYLDLEVDVVHRAGEEPFLIDREKLAMVCRSGCISEELGKKALAVAEGLL
jgi:predicted RNA-binding protein associated with RNAse of E/G family